MLAIRKRLKIKENVWILKHYIQKLETLHPKGLNRVLKKKYSSMLSKFSYIYPVEAFN